MEAVRALGGIGEAARPALPRLLQVWHEDEDEEVARKAFAARIEILRARDNRKPWVEKWREQGSRQMAVTRWMYE